MKECKKLVFLLPILLTSCSSSPNAIYGINDYDFISDKNKTTLTVDLSTNDLIYLLDSKTSRVCSKIVFSPILENCFGKSEPYLEPVPDAKIIA